MTPRASWLAAVGACAVLAVAGCSSKDVIADPTTATSTPTVSSSASSTTTASPSSASPTVSSRPPTTSSATPSASEASTSVPLPAGLTPAQVADAEAAVGAYVGYSELVDRAYADPGKDWSKEAAKWAVDPVKSSLLSNLAGTAKLGQYTSGAIELNPRVTKVETGLVTIKDCVDSTNTDFFDSTGRSIKAPNVPGSYFRHPSEIQVALYETGKWLVTFITDDYNTAC